MAPCSFRSRSLTAHTCPSHGHLSDEAMSQSYPNKALHGITRIYCAHIKRNIDILSLSNTAQSTLPPYPPSYPPLYTSSSPLFSLLPNLFSDPNSGSNLPNQPTTWIIPATRAFVQPASESIASAPTTAPTAANISQTGKFSCYYCAKVDTSQPRARTCPLNHTSARPSACGEE
ncbi:hypothetical protein CPB86DRAFT_820054 [Serendipita vermifera]|nr:hypothetical protein CPB86DRAFT_820054 [Serendipita vermifera]